MQKNAPPPGVEKRSSEEELQTKLQVRARCAELDAGSRASEIKVDARAATAAPAPLWVVENVVSLRANQDPSILQLKSLSKDMSKFSGEACEGCCGRVAEGQTLGAAKAHALKRSGPVPPASHAAPADALRGSPTRSA